MGEARSSQSDGPLALDAGWRGGHVRRAWHRCGRHQRRRPRRHPQRVRMVGAARDGHDRHVDVPPAAVRPSKRTRRARWSRDVRVRRQRRQTQRRCHVAAGARVRARVVRAEARCRWKNLVREAHDFGQLRHEERRRRGLLSTARLGLCRHERRRYDRLRHRQTVLLAQRELCRSRSLRGGGALRLPHGSQQAGARRRRIRARAGAQPVRGRLAGARGGSEQGRRDGHRHVW